MPTHTLPPPGWEIVDSGDEAEQNEFEYLQHPEVGPKSFYGTLYPVFLTAKIPVDVSSLISSRAMFALTPRRRSTAAFPGAPTINSTGTDRVLASCF